MPAGDRLQHSAGRPFDKMQASRDGNEYKTLNTNLVFKNSNIDVSKLVPPASVKSREPSPANDDPKDRDCKVGRGAKTAPSTVTTSINYPSAAEDGSVPDFTSNLEGALWWFDFGYKVMPMVPGRKRPFLNHYPWADEVTADAIREHWALHPDHEVGAILEPNQIILDADTPEAHEALQRIEKQFGLAPALIIKTQRGYHHHFQMETGAFAKADSHAVDKFPDRIDIRASKNSALLTPSLGKSIEHLDAEHRHGLTQVGQDFIDAVFQHNGRTPPRPLPEIIDSEPLTVSTDLATLTKLLGKIDPNCGYQDWLTVLMAIFHETGGSDDGLALADQWSKQGKAYKGRAEIEIKWASFSVDVASPVTVATLIARAREAGADVTAIMAGEFQPCTTKVIHSPAPGIDKAVKAHPLRKHSLIGQAAKYDELAQPAAPLLGDVSMSGEATVWYAKHNAGKTLLTLSLLSEAIERKRIAAGDVYYINADDSSSGVAEKLGILDELGAHTLVPGQSGFKAADLQALLSQAAADRTARGSLVIIDTLKKFTDLMNKQQASGFANVCREFVSAGGSVLGLAHTNKRKGDDGKPIHAGTSDILDDFDAGYIIDVLEPAENPREKVIEFTRLKGRAGGVETVAYAYGAEDGLSYSERLASVTIVGPDDLEGFKRNQAECSDAEIIEAVERSITDGIDTKIALSKTVSERANTSRRHATQVIERYTGDDPSRHRWCFDRKAHGAKVFRLLTKDAVTAGTGESRFAGSQNFSSSG